MHVAVIVGGSGALGRELIDNLKIQVSDCLLICVDRVANSSVEHNVIVSTDTDASIVDKVGRIVSAAVKESPTSVAVFAVAGGWTGGSLSDAACSSEKSQSFMSQLDLMWKQNVESSVLAALIAYSFQPGKALLILTAASVAIKGTPSMPAYGMSKAAVIHLAKSLIADERNTTRIVTILPETIDTEANRKAMPNADTSKWTPPKDISNQMIHWFLNEESTKDSVFVKVVTRNNQTSFTTIDLN